MSIEVTKFKRTAKGDIHIEYTQMKADVEIGLQMTNPEAPSQEFDKALTDIVPHFVGLAELPSGEVDNIKIMEITFSKTGEDRTLGWLAIAHYNLQKITGKRIVKIPKFLCHDGNAAGTGETNICSHAISETIYEFIKQCEKYIDGERLQINSGV